MSVGSEDRLGPPELRLVDVGIGFAGTPVLEGVNVTVAPGVWFTLVGPSGSGKTTLLRLLGGYQRPDTGETHVSGAPWDVRRRSDSLTVRRTIGYVQQQPGFLRASARENVATPLRWRGVAREDANRIADAHLEAVDLRPAAERNAIALSGGERQRLSLARALAHRPSILLLDEFVNQQDPDHVDLLEALVAHYERRGATIVIAAHDLGQTRRLRRRIPREPEIGVTIGNRCRVADWGRISAMRTEPGAVGTFLRRAFADDGS